MNTQLIGNVIASCVHERCNAFRAFKTSKPAPTPEEQLKRYKLFKKYENARLDFHEWYKAARTQSLAQSLEKLTDLHERYIEQKTV